MAGELTEANVSTLYQRGDAAMFAVFGLRNVSVGDTIDLATVSQPRFQVIKRSMVMGESTFVEIAAEFSGTVVTMPGGLDHDSGWLTVWGA
jgi:hypothetical protein